MNSDTPTPAAASARPWRTENAGLVWAPSGTQPVARCLGHSATVEESERCSAVARANSEHIVMCVNAYESNQAELQHLRSKLGTIVTMLLQEHFDEARERALRIPLEFPDGAPVAQLREAGKGQG